jgi:hypothetical protein
MKHNISNKELTKLVGNDNTIIEIIHKSDYDLIFYANKEYVKSGGNDLYRAVGLGPIYFDKNTNKYKQLSLAKYLELYGEEVETKNNEEFIPTLEYVIKQIKKRKHINDVDYYYFMVNKKIEHLEVEVSFRDEENVIIKSENKSYISLFKSFFCTIGFPFTEISNGIKGKHTITT